MKSVFLFFLSLLFSTILFGQGTMIQLNISGIINKKINKELGKGIRVQSVMYDFTFKENIKITCLTNNGKSITFDYSGNKNFINNFNYESLTTKTFWGSIALKEDVYGAILDYKNHNEMRFKMEQESLEILNFLEQIEAFHKDAYLSDYLQKIILKFFPEPLNDGRIKPINVKIIKNNEPYSSILPNGTLLVSIGLLTTLNSEEELLALLINETTHYVLDHHVKNVSQTVKKNKEEVWEEMSKHKLDKIGSELTIENDLFLDPSLVQTSIESKFSITSEFSDLSGTNYSIEQKLLADSYTTELLELINIEKEVLASALKKILNYNYSIGYFNASNLNSSYANIEERLKYLNSKNTEISHQYDKTIASLISLNAFYEYNAYHYKIAESLLNRIIASNAAFEEDLILKVLTNLILYDSSEKIAESLELIEKAKTIEVNPDGKIFKYETILHLRNNDSESAQQSLTFYIATIENHIEEFDKTLLTSKEWTSFYNNLKKELIWAKKLLYKIYE